MNANSLTQNLLGDLNKEGKKVKKSERDQRRKQNIKPKQLNAVSLDLHYFGQNVHPFPVAYLITTKSVHEHAAPPDLLEIRATRPLPVGDTRSMR